MFGGFRDLGVTGLGKGSLCDPSGGSAVCLFFFERGRGGAGLWLA